MNQRLLLAIIGAGSFVSGWLTLILDRLPKRAKAVANNAEGQY